MKPGVSPFPISASRYPPGRRLLSSARAVLERALYWISFCASTIRENGSVLIDGHDLRDVTIASVRGAMALLTQDPVLFDDTIAANICYGSEGASEEAMMAAAEAAAAHDFIMRLPKGYQTLVGETGNRLSGGERQRIAFARAMLRDSPIILLDEPTSALDAEIGGKVQEAMLRLLAGRTVVMIAHRLATVQRPTRSATWSTDRC